MLSNPWFWRPFQMAIGLVWALVLWSLFWPAPSLFRHLCWGTLAVVVVVHGIEAIWFVRHHARSGAGKPDGKAILGVLLFGLFFFVPYLRARRAQNQSAQNAT